MVDSRIPMGSGLSSSAAISVALTRGLNQLFHLGLSNHEIAEISYQAEREDLSIACGRMDQYSIAYGGVTFIETGERPLVTPLHLPNNTTTIDGDVLHTPLPSIVVGDSQEPRKARDILNRIQTQIDAKDPIVLDAIHNVCQGVLKGRDALLEGDYQRFGQLMCQQQQFENILQASTRSLNAMCHAAMEAGALGAKLTGAGGGGCMLALCPVDKTQEVVQAIEHVGGRAWVFDIFEY
jgi:galactokinase/mevalonate kinase-like predicted kinase